MDFWFGYTNHEGHRDEERNCTPVSIRFGSSNWHRDEGWLLLGWDKLKDAAREYSMRDMFGVRPHYTFLLFSKSAVSQVVTRLEEIARYSRMKVEEANPKALAECVKLAHEALTLLRRAPKLDGVVDEQAERLYLPENMPNIWEIAAVLGQNPGRAINFAAAGRVAGQDIPRKAECEWALIHWHSLRLYLIHGKDGWQKELQALVDTWIAEAKIRAMNPDPRGAINDAQQT